ncbi:MAG: ArgE/DapE family deacylase [Anaerolineales bacterium]|nr:ArgE/DapE family deacylase [Anaerolineales bacterium]
MLQSRGVSPRQPPGDSATANVRMKAVERILGSMKMDVKNRIRERITQMSDRIVDLTCRLVAIPTENPPGRSYAECVELIEAELDALDLPYEVIEVPGGGEYPRYVLISGYGTGPTLYLHGHYDVVLANHPSQFNPIIHDGRIEGRGTSDMKGGIAAMVYALSALRPEKLNGRIEIVLVPDEETGGRLGCEFLARSDRFARDGIGVIVGEPTSGVIWNASRGAVTLRVRVKGKLAHVALHYEGRNAFEGALPILTALQELKAQVEKQRTSFTIEPEGAKRSILMLGGEVTGGRQFNTVPDQFSFTIERRFNPEEDLEREKKALLEAIDGARPKWVEVEVEVIQEGESSATDEDSTVGRALADSIEDVTGNRPSFELCPGLLESRFYSRRGMPALAYGPGVLSVSHGPEEYVEVERLVECTEIYALTALKLLRRE